MNFILVLLTRDSKIIKTEHPVRKPNDRGKPRRSVVVWASTALMRALDLQNRLPA
jgi:hypothetical protein